MATAGESARSVGESLFYDLNEDPPDFLDEVIDKDAEELPEVSDVEHLVQGVVEEVSTSTTIEKSTPLDYFNAFIPETERYEKWKMNSNMYAVTQGVGTDKYHNFKPFSAADMDLVV
eukprot:gene8765-10388_t